MDQAMKARLRPAVSEWVLDQRPGAVEVAPHSGQRFVFRIENEAIKLLPNLEVADRERCEREVRFLLDHELEGLPRALTDLSSESIGGVSFSVYSEQWIEGETLFDAVATSGRDSELADRLVTDGGRILAQLHAANVVHRDVSPNNVLIGDQVWVVDLGLAKYLDLEPITGTVERLKMTPQFASPEQITSGSASLGPPTDVYSLAMVSVYTRNAGHPFLTPTDRLSPADYLARMAHRDFPHDIDVSSVEYEMLNPIAVMRPSLESLQ